MLLTLALAPGATAWSTITLTSPARSGNYLLTIQLTGDETDAPLAWTGMR